MEQLKEHEFGFATDGMGFPSIQACRAILYQNANGLFGYHNLGGSGSTQWSTRAKQFADYVRDHPQGGLAGGLNLFIVTFVTNLSGYTPTTSLKDWKGEAAAFADALTHTGPRYGFNLSALYPTGSAYVEFRPVAGTCTIQVQNWLDADVLNTQPHVPSDNHKMNPASPFKSARPPFITSMNTARLQRVNYETLR
jgi:hypothetical protein